MIRTEGGGGSSHKPFCESIRRRSRKARNPISKGTGRSQEVRRMAVQKDDYCHMCPGSGTTTTSIKAIAGRNKDVQGYCWPLSARRLPFIAH